MATRWKNIWEPLRDGLGQADQKSIADHGQLQTVIEYIEGNHERALGTTGAKHLSLIVPLPRTMANFTGTLERSILPAQIDLSMLWGLIYLNVKLSIDTPDKLRRTVEWLSKVRRVVELFNRCLDVCADESEARLAMVDMLDPILGMLGDSVKFFRTNYTSTEISRAWPEFRSSIGEYLVEADSTVKHLNEITTYSELERRVVQLAPHTIAPVEVNDPSTYPNVLLPYAKNELFYGREDELGKIQAFLDWKNAGLRTYTLYGRRGVGKTQIALEYAYRLSKRFDAVFWIRCETPASLRQSFTDVAVSLNLPGADKSGHHEENSVAVQKWLNKTKRTWMMIFDNAEDEKILKGYWPIGAQGAILITQVLLIKFQILLMMTQIILTGCCFCFLLDPEIITIL